MLLESLKKKLTHSLTGINFDKRLGLILLKKTSKV